jgi:hypothetical protein
MKPLMALLVVWCVFPMPIHAGETAVPPRLGSDTFQSALGAEHLDKLRARLAALNADIAAKGMLQPPDQPKPLLTGYAYGQFYDWDFYFENLYLSYYGNSDFCFNNFKAFMSLEKPNGFIQRSFGPKGYGTTQQFKPFLAQIAILGSKQRGDNFEWLRGAYYDGLGKYINLWYAADADSNSLPVWQSADASGMDNENRRAGGWDSYTDEGTDLACYVYRELQAMAFIAGKLGKADDQKAYLARSEALAKNVNAILWDDKAGFYIDRDKKTGKRISLMSAVGFLPLWAGIASPEQARRLVKEHLLNEKEFWLKYPIATYAATEPDFYEGSRSGECNWCGPAWIPVNYMVMHGLLRYGFRDAARELASRTFKMALDENPVTREFYDSDTGKGNGMNPFWGWSSLAYVMPLEAEIGYDPMDDATSIQPWLSRDLGIKSPQR